MTHSDKFSIFHIWRVVLLRCDVCHVRDFGSGDIFDWNDEEDMNLAALVSRSQAHWAQYHERKEGA